MSRCNLYQRYWLTLCAVFKSFWEATSAVGRLVSGVSDLTTHNFKSIYRPENVVFYPTILEGASGFCSRPLDYYAARTQENCQRQQSNKRDSCLYTMVLLSTYRLLIFGTVYATLLHKYTRNCVYEVNCCGRKKYGKSYDYNDKGRTKSVKANRSW